MPNLCIEFVEAVEYGQDSMVTADEVTDKSELLNRLDVSAAASLQGIGPVSGSVKVEFAEQSKVNSFHSTFVLEARVDNGVKFLAPAPTTRRGRFEAKQAQASQYIRRAPFPEGGVRLTEAARSLAAKGDKAFRFVCGDSFVSAIYEGARLYATITLKDSSREKQERWAASMSAEGWGAGISGSGLSATDKKDLFAKMAVTVLQTGGSGGELSLDKEGIARMLKALPEGALRGPKFNRIALTSYDELPGWPAGPLVTDQTELEQVVSYWGAYSTLYDDIDFVLSNRDQFSFEILSASYFKTLEGLQDDLLRKIEDIAIVAKKCSDQGGVCEFSEEAFPHPYDYRIWLPLPTELTPAKPPFREWRQDWRRELYYQDYRGRVADYHVRQRVRKKCLANKAAFGCIKHELPTKRLAQRRMDTVLARVNGLDYRPGRVATFEEFVERWSAKVLTTQQPSSARAVNSHLNRHIIPQLAKLRLEQFGTENQQAFITRVFERGVSRKTVLNVLGTLSSILGTARDWGYNCEKIDVSKLRLPPRDQRYEAPHFTVDQLQRILAMAEEPWHTLFCILTMDGLRAGEVLGLQWEDIDLDRRLLHIRRSAWYGRIQTTKSKASETVLPIPRPLATVLKNYREQWKPNPQGFLFVTRNGRPPSSNKVVEYRLWTILDALGIPRCGLHAFRHSHTALLLDSGATPKVVQRQLRHADARTTLEVYGHVVGEAQRQAVEKVASIVDGSGRQLTTVN